MKKKIAAIDFGTNTARLLIADCFEAHCTVSTVCLEREVVRMGGGFTKEVGLSQDAIGRGLACLERFSNILKKHDISAVRAVATSAVRDAANRQHFLSLVEQSTGIPLKVIDGDLEGELTMRGVLSGLDMSYDSLLLFDVGGGSTEYTVMQNGETVFVKSLPLGVVRLTEGKNSPEEMLDKIDRELMAVQSTMSDLGIDWHADALVGTAGTATTLAAISMRMSDYDYRRVNNSSLSLEEVRCIYELLLPLTLSERLQVPGLEKGREDLIIAGCLITIRTMEQFGFSTLKVSDFGLLEGLVVAGDMIS